MLRAYPIVGWREWVSLPDLGVGRIKAKIDTGARTSALHAWNIDPFERNGERWVRFEIHPFQLDDSEAIATEARLIERRSVRSSSGHSNVRPVITTDLALFGLRWPIQISLTQRDEMGFRMLLGREALRGRLLVDPGRSYCAGGVRYASGGPAAASGPLESREGEEE